MPGSAGPQSCSFAIERERRIERRRQKCSCLDEPHIPRQERHGYKLKRETHTVNLTHTGYPLLLESKKPLLVTAEKDRRRSGSSSSSSDSGSREKKKKKNKGHRSEAERITLKPFPNVKDFVAW